MSDATKEGCGPDCRREFLVATGRGAALVGLAWLAGGLALRSWRQPAGGACRLATACGDCARRGPCAFPEIRDARRRAE
jgi:hypothetical protein